MLPNAYIDALADCGVTLTAMLQKGRAVGVCFSLLDSHDDPEQAQRAQGVMAEWSASRGKPWKLKPKRPGKARERQPGLITPTQWSKST